MKTLDDIIDKIHEEQKQHDISIADSRNEYQAYLDEKYSKNDNIFIDSNGDWFVRGYIVEDDSPVDEWEALHEELRDFFDMD